MKLLGFSDAGNAFEGIIVVLLAKQSQVIISTLASMCQWWYQIDIVALDYFGMILDKNVEKRLSKFIAQKILFFHLFQCVKTGRDSKVKLTRKWVAHDKNLIITKSW